MTRHLPDGLYVITDQRHRSTASLVARVAAAVRGGARIVQYRNKQATGTQRLEQARALLALCRRLHVPLIINDDLPLAGQLQADGIHLGGTDADIAQARAVLGNRAIVGASCYNSLERADRAVRDGADYVAFGRFFPSRTKPDAPLADITLLSEARAAIDRPVVAIGGITAENGGSLLAAGANLLAVIEGVFGQADIEQAACAVSRLFRQVRRDGCNNPGHCHSGRT